MSAIYLVFDLGGMDADKQQDFRNTVTTHATSYPDKPQDVYISRYFCAASSHHGYLPSGGVASSNQSAVVVAGSCWTEDEADRLSTPVELLALWQKRSWEAIPQMSGLFSFGYFNQTRMELVVESEYFGSMPLYYREDPHGLTVASEMKFLLRPGQDKPNPEAIAEFMELGFLSRPHTPIDGIKRLPANSRLVYGHQGLRIIPFPTTTYTRSRTLDQSALEEYDLMVRHYFRRFEDVSDRFLLFLSGGLDSRLVAYAAKRAGLTFDAFTTGERASLDTVIAGRVAQNLDVPIDFHKINPRDMPAWFTKMVWLTEGRVHPGHMHYLPGNFCQAIPSVPQLNGLGLEAVLGGHFENQKLQLAGPGEIRQACLDATTGLNYWPDSARQSVFMPAIMPSVKETIPAVAEALFTRIGFSGVYSDIIEYRTQLKVVDWAMPCIIGQLLPWADVVNPYYDRRAYDFGATLSSGGIANRAGQIRWGLEYFPGFADAPRVKSGVLIPIALDLPDAYEKGMNGLLREAKLKYYIGRLTQGRVNLPMKNSFPQYWQWYPQYREVRDYVDGILLSDRTFDRGFFQREGVQKLLHDCRVGRKTWNAVGTLLITELFLRQFIDGTDIPDDRQI